MDSDEDDRLHVNSQFRKETDEDYEDEHRQSSNDSESSSNSSVNHNQLNQRQLLEYGILQSAIKGELSTAYQELITKELIDKLNGLNKVTSQKTGEDLVNIKIQELALNKLLVLNYGKSDFRLVVSHYHLGEAYLSYECLEQAIEHITIALHKNQKLAEELPQTELLQITMHITLAEAFMAQNNYDDAIDTLNKAQSLQDRYNTGLEHEGSDPIRNVKTQVLKAQCLCKQKNFSQALDAIDQVISYTRSQQLGKVEHAFAMIDKANILAQIDSKQKLQKAIEYQEQGINMLVNENYPKPEEVAELYATLSNFYQRINNSESALTCIQKVKTLYEELYSPEDKRVVKARRKIATALLKSQRYKEAVTQLLEIAKLQEKVFGQTAQLARTLKLLGTVYSSLGIGDSKVYLKRAMNIFQATGNKKQALEIKEKLRHLLVEHPTGEMDANIISEQQI